MKSAMYLILLFLIYTELFFGVTCKSISNNILQEIVRRESPGSCETVKFLGDSNFTKSCVFETFPVNSTKLEDNKNQTILCLALYDFSSKWCTRSSQQIMLPEIANATEFDSQVAKFASTHNLLKFCFEKKVSINSMFEVELQNLYNDPVKCIEYCYEEIILKNLKPKEICFALSWLDDILKTHNKTHPAFTEGKKVLSEDDKTTEKNTEVIITGGKTDKPKSPKAVPKGEDKMDRKISSKPKDQEPLKGSSTILNDKSSSVVDQKENETLANTEAKFEKINDSTKKNVYQDPQNLSKDNPFKQDATLPPETKEEVKEEIENTEGKPPSVEEVSKIGKKPEVNNEKLAKEQKAGEIKSNTLSENTDELNENLGIGGEDSDAQVQAAENEEDLPDETGSSNQVQELPPRREVHYHSTATEDESHFFSYLVILSLLFVCCYITYHNKKKIFAILLEGRRSRSGRGRRRPSTANYRKLDCNLEEAVTSQCNSNVTHVIY